MFDLEVEGVMAVWGSGGGAASISQSQGTGDGNMFVLLAFVDSGKDAEEITFFCKVERRGHQRNTIVVEPRGPKSRLKYDTVYVFAIFCQYKNTAKFDIQPQLVYYMNCRCLYSYRHITQQLFP